MEVQVGWRGGNGSVIKEKRTFFFPDGEVPIAIKLRGRGAVNSTAIKKKNEATPSDLEKISGHPDPSSRTISIKTDISEKKSFFFRIKHNFNIHKLDFHLYMGKI